MNALNTSIKTHDCDLLVVGSGAGGMAAAITAKLHGLDVLIVEKESVYGGTTARSGGWLWIPANPLAAREGIKDSKEAARTYLQHLNPEYLRYYFAAKLGSGVDDLDLNLEDFTQRVLAEYDLTRRLVLEVTGHKQLLENRRVLSRAVQLRDPYVDALSHLQLRALSALRAQTELTEHERDRLSTLLLLSVNGVAAGLQNTG